MTESLVEIADNPDILGRLSVDERARVVSRGRLREYAPGELVFEQGGHHDGIFVIRGGLVRSFYVGANGREITLAYWTPGHFVGGPEIFGGGEHMWTAEAVERSNIVHLPGNELRALVQEIPKLAVGLIEALVHKGKCYSALLQLLGTKPAMKRLAHLILTLAKRAGRQNDRCVVIDVSFTHEELANMIGATRQLVSLMLDRFEKDGIINCDKQRITVLEPRRLTRISE